MIQTRKLVFTSSLRSPQNLDVAAAFNVEGMQWHDSVEVVRNLYDDFELAQIDKKSSQINDYLIKDKTHARTHETRTHARELLNTINITMIADRAIILNIGST